MSAHREIALLRERAREDPEIAYVVMLALASTPPLAREAWVDLRLAGIPLAEIASREGLTPQAVSLRVQAAERALRAYLRPDQPRRVAA